MAGDGAIKRNRIKLAERIVGRVRKINDDEIKTVRVRIDPWKSIGIDDMHPWGEQRFIVELGQHGMRREKLGHLRIEIYQRDTFDLRVLQDFADREAVAAAENQDVTRSWNGGQA